MMMFRLTRRQDLIMRVLGWPLLCAVLMLIAVVVTLQLTDDRIVIALVLVTVFFSAFVLLRATSRMIEREIGQWERDGRP